MKKMKDGLDVVKNWGGEMTYQLTHGFKEKELPTDLEIALHDAAIQGDKFLLRKILAKGSLYTLSISIFLLNKFII